MLLLLLLLADLAAETRVKSMVRRGRRGRSSSSAVTAPFSLPSSFFAGVQEGRNDDLGQGGGRRWG